MGEKTTIVISQPLLSICIPTYNRASILAQTLQSILSDPIFLKQPDIEIVISNNWSTDHTADICASFVKQYPNHIRYVTPEKRLTGDENFYYVLNQGKGKCLKLNNDKCSYLPSSLSKIYRFIASHSDESSILFFPNRLKHTLRHPLYILGGGEERICNSINEFIDYVSYLCTWIGAFSIWSNDFHAIEDFTRAKDLQLIQTDIILRQLYSGKTICVYNENLFSSLKTNDSLTYLPAQVFGVNYLEILRNYVQLGCLDNTLYHKEQKRILFGVIGPLSLTYNTHGISDYKDTWGALYPHYKTHFYFYFWFMTALIRRILFLASMPFEAFYTPIKLRYKFYLYRFLGITEKANKYKDLLLLYQSTQKE